MTVKLDVHTGQMRDGWCDRHQARHPSAWLYVLDDAGAAVQVGWFCDNDNDTSPEQAFEAAVESLWDTVADLKHVLSRGEWCSWADLDQATRDGITPGLRVLLNQVGAVVPRREGGDD